MEFRIMKTLFSVSFVLILFLTASAVAQQTFTNPATITINDFAAAYPYPSNITVSGLSGTITDINVRLNGLSHSFLNDAAILLVAPDTNRRMVLLSDCGGNPDTAVGGDVTNITLTFDDQAAALIPCGFSTLSTGSYRPTSGFFDNGTFLDPADFFQAPAPQNSSTYSQPAPSGSSTLNGVFGGANPNGTWSLYVIDKATEDDGVIAGGYSLVITTNSPPPTAAPVSVGGRVITPKGRGIGGVQITMNDSRGNLRTATTTSFGYYRFEDCEAGETYIFSAIGKRYDFAQSSQVLSVTEDVADVDFIGVPVKK